MVGDKILDFLTSVVKNIKASNNRCWCVYTWFWTSDWQLRITHLLYFGTNQIDVMRFEVGKGNILKNSDIK